MFSATKQTLQKHNKNGRCARIGRWSSWFNQHHNITSGTPTIQGQHWQRKCLYSDFYPSDALKPILRKHKISSQDGGTTRLRVGQEAVPSRTENCWRLSHCRKGQWWLIAKAMYGKRIWPSRYKELWNKVNLNATTATKIVDQTRVSPAVLTVEIPTPTWLTNWLETFTNQIGSDQYVTTMIHADSSRASQLESLDES